ECTRHEEVARAIADMVTQSGGPYTAAAMGMALAAYEARRMSEDEFIEHMTGAAYTLSHARPTTSKKMEAVTASCLSVAEEAVKQGRRADEAVFLHAIELTNHRYNESRKAAKYLVDKIPKDGTIMTQCFAETVIGMILRECRERGNNVKVICPETRPYFQGARLTASVAYDMGFDVTVISDNMPAYVMKAKGVDLFTSAADVICMDGHIVNKVGTFQIALAAKHWGIPYYVTGTPDRKHPTVDTVKIEERDGDLVLEAMGVRTAMQGVKGFYPAFDITPPDLCEGVVTDKAIYSPFELERYYK
ncbi:MAG TPA: s-methyl-5-thioribose-1-phosphate isomerase, partial [Firmicutes bacterium]|nr:s-methyl-5-thioribose-1-phosphate isomerase [Candidatus Fermentithermobacillaceae bacterium]